MLEWSADQEELIGKYAAFETDADKRVLSPHPTCYRLKKKKDLFFNFGLFSSPPHFSFAGSLVIQLFSRLILK